MIIGLTGSKASGKGAIAEFLKKDKAAYFSLSDIVREEATKKLGKNWGIKDLQDVGNELREKEGPGTLARILVKKLQKEEYSIVDGIRNLGEIEVLRAQPNFYLVGVDAYRKTRFERMLSRGRESDPKTMEDFIIADSRDQGAGESSTGQQVGLCMDSSDFMLFNDGISLNGLYTTFQQQFLNTIKGLTVRRPTEDETWMSVAYDVSKRSTCLRRHVGAALVDKYGKIASTGYNGAAKNLLHCDELGGCIRVKEKIASGTMQEKCRAVHAEENALMWAGEEKSRDSTLYVTVSPCTMCARKIINCEIAGIIYDGSYPDEDAVKMLGEAKIPMKRFTGVRPRAYHILFK